MVKSTFPGDCRAKVCEGVFCPMRDGRACLVEHHRLAEDVVFTVKSSRLAAAARVIGKGLDQVNWT